MQSDPQSRIDKLLRAMPEIERLDIGLQQDVADKLRAAAAIIPQNMPEVINMLNIASEQIECLCDILKAEEQLRAALNEIIDLMRQGDQ